MNLSEAIALMEIRAKQLRDPVKAARYLPPERVDAALKSFEREAEALELLIATARQSLPEATP